MEVPSSHYHLPEDLVVDILLRLPVKSLVRFKSVCKNWHALIETPNFINNHFHHDSSNTNLLVYSTGIFLRPPHSFTLFSSETLERHEEQLDRHLKLPASVYAIRGPNFQGIFCVHIKQEKLALWNPATRRMRPLPTPPKNFYMEFGFGVDPLTDESKIAIIYQKPFSKNEGYDHNEMFFRLDYAVYTLGDDSWKFVENEPVLDHCDHCCVRRTYTDTCLNGIYYWKKFNPITLNNVVLKFDMHKEVFEEIAMPNIDDPEKDSRDLTLYNNSLALLSYNSDDWAFNTELDIWVMKEKGSWKKLLTTVIPFIIDSTRGIWKNNSIFVLNHYTELFLFYLDSNKSNRGE